MHCSPEMFQKVSMKKIVLSATIASDFLHRFPLQDLVRQYLNLAENLQEYLQSWCVLVTLCTLLGSFIFLSTCSMIFLMCLNTYGH